MTLPQLTSATLPTPLATAENFGVCPTMDLISFQLNPTTLWIYRLNHQKVWDLTLEEPIGRLCWRPDGQLFAVVSKTGRTDLFDANTGDSVMHFGIGGGVEAVHWANQKRRVGASAIDGKAIDLGLFDVDLTLVLPKLSNQQLLNTPGAVSAPKDSHDGDGGGGDSGAGSNSARGSDGDNRLLDFLVVGLAGSTVSLILSGVFTVEGYKLPVEGTILSIESNDTLTNHYVVVGNGDALQIVKLATKFVETYGDNLQLVAHTCSKLISLLAYLGDAINRTNADLKPFVDYTTRIIDLLKGEIAEKEGENANPDPIYDLYDLLLTGSLSEATKTWLTDYLGDRGIKRWMKLGKQFFDGCYKTIFYEMVPTLQHILLLLAQLQGLAKWEETSSLLGLNGTEIDAALETAGQFLKSCHKTILGLNEERDNFKSVMDWLDAIIQEVTTDEKSNVNVRTKQIIEFLMSLSKSGLKHQGEGTKQLYDQLGNGCGVIFADIKEKMKSEMSAETVAVVTGGVDGDITSLDLKMHGHEGLMVVTTEPNTTKFVKFDGDDLEQMEVKDLPSSGGSSGSGGSGSDSSRPTRLQASLIDSKRYLLLKAFKDRAVLEVLSIEDQTVLNEAELEFEPEEGSEWKWLANNPTRATFCVLDAARKHYRVLEY